ncbi:CD209 antigen-like [Aplochiton taeniatus]
MRCIRGRSSDIYANVKARPGNHCNRRGTTERPCNPYANGDIESNSTPRHSLGAPNTGIEDHNLAKERDQLQISYNNLTEERDNLQRKLCVLKEMVSSPQWYKHGSSWYFVSTEEKTWNESRQDCQSRGADLVIINSREEQEFVDTLRGNKRVWIGLTDRVLEGAWRWVDGTPLITAYWRSQQPDDKARINVKDCAENTDVDPSDGDSSNHGHFCI